ncbi:F-box protein-like protein [Tanacetum coccineum]
MSVDIPFDIQMEIIKRLPVKPLIQFRSVSKQLKSFIDTSDFITGYGFRHTHPPRFLLRYKPSSSSEEKYICLVDDNDIFTQQDQDFVVTVSMLCKQFAGSVVFKTTVFGFGVSPVTKDPTIVKISYIDMFLQMNNVDNINIPWHVEVFTLSSGIWSMIPSSNLPRESIRLKSSTQVAIGRFIYWAAYDAILADDGRVTHMIMSFDLITKEFRVVDLSDCLTNRFFEAFSISKRRDSLVVYGYIIEEEELEKPVCGVWMMVYDGLVTSFRKLFTIDTPNSSVNRILGFRKSGELIMETQNRYGISAILKVYEPRSQQISDLGICGENGSFSVGSYKETLLLLDHPDCYIYSD